MCTQHAVATGDYKSDMLVRSCLGPSEPDGSSDPILKHPNFKSLVLWYLSVNVNVVCYLDIPTNPILYRGAIRALLYHMIVWGSQPLSWKKYSSLILHGCRENWKKMKTGILIKRYKLYYLHFISLSQFGNKNNKTSVASAPRRHN